MGGIGVGGILVIVGIVLGEWSGGPLDRHHRRPHRPDRLRGLCEGQVVLTHRPGAAGLAGPPKCRLEPHRCCGPPARPDFASPKSGPTAPARAGTAGRRSGPSPRRARGEREHAKRGRLCVVDVEAARLAATLGPRLTEAGRCDNHGAPLASGRDLELAPLGHRRLGARRPLTTSSAPESTNAARVRVRRDSGSSTSARGHRAGGGGRRQRERTLLGVSANAVRTCAICTSPIDPDWCR